MKMDIDESVVQQIQSENRILASDKEISYHLMSFFRHERSFSGDKFDNDTVCTEKNINIVRLLDFGDAVTTIYASLEENNYKGKDFLFCIRMQQRCSDIGIPKHFAGGIIIVYLKLVMGYDL